MRKEASGYAASGDVACIGKVEGWVEREGDTHRGMGESPLVPS